ncbi:MAG: HAD hydrolase-like protein [Clostridiaceae bacterium]
MFQFILIVNAYSKRIRNSGSTRLRNTGFHMQVLHHAPRAGGYRALLTDLDGTLIRSEEAICFALFDSFAEVGARVPSKEGILSMFGLPVEEMLFSLGGVARGEEARVAAFIAAYKRWYPIRMCAGARLIANAKETVDAVAAAGYPVCLITSERRENAHFILDALALSGAVRQMISRDDVMYFKPNPEPILLAAQLVGKAVEDCVYIGESPFDIQAGVASGVFVAAVASGNWPKESLLEQEPDVFLNDISELTVLFSGAGDPPSA